MSPRIKLEKTDWTKTPNERAFSTKVGRGRRMAGLIMIDPPSGISVRFTEGSGDSPIEFAQSEIDRLTWGGTYDVLMGHGAAKRVVRAAIACAQEAQRLS